MRQAESQAAVPGGRLPPVTGPLASRTSRCAGSRARAQGRVLGLDAIPAPLRRLGQPWGGRAATLAR